jgi:hypothetical protein
MPEENNHHLPQKSNGLVPSKTDRQTGLEIIETFISHSGFNYGVGVRPLGDLTIIEQVARGTAVSYLNGILVLDKEENLILDIKAPQNTYYSREIAQKMVLNGLLGMLEEAAKKHGKKYDKEKALTKIKKKLDEAYFKQSYISILDWAETIGLSLQKL